MGLDGWGVNRYSPVETFESHKSAGATRAMSGKLKTISPSIPKKPLHCLPLTAARGFTLTTSGRKRSAMYLLAMRSVDLLRLRLKQILYIEALDFAFFGRSFGSELPGLPSGVVNTQDPKDKPIPPEEAVRRM